MGIRRGSISTPIIADGLVFNMDAANRASYPKTGDTITDTIGITTGTFNGNTFLNINEGVIDFDGSDDYTTVSNFNVLANSNNFTVSFWVNFTSLGYYDTILNHYSTIGIKAHRAGSKMQFLFSSADSTSMSVTSTTTISTGTWENYLCTYDNVDFKIYIDGVLNNTSNLPGENYVSNLDQDLILGKYWFGGRFFNGNIANIQVYNHALSANEVLHNYNALKSRFD